MMNGGRLLILLGLGIDYGVFRSFQNIQTFSFSLTSPKSEIMEEDCEKNFVQNSIIKDKIFHVSIIAKELSLHHRDLLIFGLMSREELQKKEILKLLNAIHKKEPEDFRLRLDDGFDSFLVGYLT